IPVGLAFADVPSMDSGPATLTNTLPPFPDRLVELAITPLLLMANAPALTVRLPALPAPLVKADILPLLRRATLPALTIMFPAFPVLCEAACEAIPVKELGAIAPSMVNAPATLTKTFPPLPRPEVWLEIA